MINEQIYISSLARKIYSAKIKGILDTSKVQIFNLFKYYINFAQSLSDNGSTQFEDLLICLKREASNFQYKYPKDICNYKVIIPNSVFTGGIDNTNVAPTVSDNTISIGTEESYRFSVEDFLVSFSDANGDSYKYLLIYPITNPAFGTLSTDSLDVVNVSSPIIINIEGLSGSSLLSLYYTRADSDVFGPVAAFTFRVSDNALNYLYSGLQTLNVSGTAFTNNLPPTDIGDNTIYSENREITTLTLYMFTEGLTAPYNDPEGDAIDAIKVIDISNANSGTYYVNGVAIIEGQIITREEIQSGLFTHEAADQDAISSDTFQFQARDEGSQIWVD